MGISGGKIGSGRAAGSRSHSRVARRTGDRGQGSLSGATYLCISRLSGFSSAHAALRMPAMGRHAQSIGSSSDQVGSSGRTERLSDAAGRLAADTDAARTVLKLLASEAGTTAIEYAIVAAFLSILIVAGVTELGQNVNNEFFVQIAQNLP
jgi:Flp pilus assembly pilin Flp